MLEADSIDAADLTFDPELPGAYIRIQGNWIGIEGPIVGGTVYEMTVPGELTDVFGQTLGADEVIEFHVDDSFPFLDFDRGRLVTLDPLVDSQTLPLQLRNHSEVRVRAFAVDPSDWAAFAAYWDDRWDEDGLPTPPWPEIYDQVQATGAPINERFESRIDLEPVFGGEPGMAVVVIEGVGELADLSREDRRYWENQPVVQWVQATSLGADLLVDDRTGYAWVTDLTTGAPVEGASVELVGGQGAATNGDGLAEIALPRPVSTPDRWSRRSVTTSPSPRPRANVSETVRSGALVRRRRPGVVPPRRDRERQGLGAPPRPVGRRDDRAVP